ncbi:hypothetical protein DN069_09720 [Streptacidiphilus pinicola]|uniref:Right handed beta helix domain-containing protein n=2 Tax=Streptacidiphilus pinicola TaxID=2219663 RepID=A0A2X0J651_9ACTN|nr:hypothetical protein DN069_09720 [Streptacidiphilus pinicola]
MSSPAAALQKSPQAAAEDDTAYIQQLLDNPVGNVVNLPYRPPSNPFIIRPGLTIPRGEVISGNGTTLRVMSGYGNYRAVLTAPASSDLSGLTIKGVDFDQNSAGNPISGMCASTGSQNCLSPASPRFVLAVLSGTGITITQDTFTGTNNTNTVVTGGGTHNVILSYNTFSTVDSPWHDHSSVYTSGTNTEIYGNTFNGNAAVAAAVEVHGDQVNVSANKISGYYRGFNIVASDTVLSNNTVYAAANVVDLFSVTAPSLHNVAITQNSIQLNLPYWRPVMQSLGRAMPAPQYTQFVIYDAASTYPFAAISITGNKSIPLS